MDYLCLLLPSIVFCYVYEKHNATDRTNHTKFDVLRLLTEYVVSFVCINGLLITIWSLKNHNGSIDEALNHYSMFAVKYLVAAVLLAIIAPYLIGCLKRTVKIGVSISVDRIVLPARLKTVMLVAYGLILSSLHFVRCFDNSFWGDEGITIKASRLNWTGMLHYVAQNGHSPFQYAFEWLCCHVFGESGFIIHFASALPYFLIMLTSITLVKKWFGRKTSIILMTLCTFLYNAVTYNLEVRMYAWCELFILMAFLMNYGIFSTNKTVYYALMSLFSVGAVYSHYFALASIGILYLGLLIYKIFRQNLRDVLKVVISGGSVLILFLPWLIFAKGTNGTVISNYRLGTTTWKACFEFIFSSKHSWFLLICFGITTLLALIYETQIVKVEKDDARRLNISFQLFPKYKMKPDGRCLWVIIGIFAVFGTIIFSQVFSALVFPITLLRYLYVSYVIVWFVFALSVSRLKNSKLLTILLVIFVITSCWQNYYQTYSSEKKNNERLKNTLKATAEIGENDFIFTDSVHFAWTIADVYYPATQHELFGHAEWWGPNELPVLDHSYTYWLFLSEEITEELQKDLHNQGKRAEQVVDHGFVGTGNAYIYMITDF